MYNNQNNQPKKKNIGGIWVRQSKAGKGYMSISVEIDGKKVNLIAFKNTYKQADDKKPDYEIYPSEDRQAAAPAPAPAAAAPAPAPAYAYRQATPDNDLPF